ncbi:MAG: M28 family metallopeptidase [Pseudomonadota bacterium]
MMLKKIITGLLFIFPITFTFASEKQTTDVPIDMIMSHIESLAGESGIGPRIAASDEEKAAARWIEEEFRKLNIPVITQPFERIFNEQSEPQKSQNVIATIQGTSDKTLIIGSHYDSVPSSTGSMGVIDNAGSVGLMIALARHLKSLPAVKTGFVFIAFGAEEVGLNGAKHFVESLDDETTTLLSKENILGMINLDSITGGDYQYIHSAKTAGYRCDNDASNFKADPKWRDALLVHANALTLPFKKHSGNDEFPAGETGDWSDHSPFACAGIPIVHIEATNFDIAGQGGQDGYSQTINPAMWSCFEEATLSACDRPSEEKWGRIWHSEFDRLDVLNEAFPGRLETQLTNVYVLLADFFETLEDM